ncbi:hypothetical protein MUK42_32721 [Musa troglodytarum]|uniref:Uncharacterized protein n=1 Tax=Musa troglodytarum TaxID=320322 RepID=A0A9E7FZT2_9LILI|nr:hypothetical protein MUK42_32721 [Musa troglodytarum]
MIRRRSIAGYHGHRIAFADSVTLILHAGASRDPGCMLWMVKKCLIDGEENETSEKADNLTRNTWQLDGEILHVQRDVLFRRLQVNVLNWDNFKDLCRSSLVCDKDPTPKSGVDLTATHSFGGPRSRILFGHSG